MDLFFSKNVIKAFNITRKEFVVTASKSITETFDYNLFTLLPEWSKDYVVSFLLRQDRYQTLANSYNVPVAERRLATRFTARDELVLSYFRTAHGDPPPKDVFILVGGDVAFFPEGTWKDVEYKRILYPVTYNVSRYREIFVKGG